MTLKPAKLHLISFVFIIALVAGFAYNILFPKQPFCANSISCTESTKLKVENNEIGIFNGQKVVPPKIDLTQKEEPSKVLGDKTLQGEKHIYVDLTHQTLTAYQGDTLVLKAPISSGKWAPTPPGEYTIWVKLRATRMTGGQGADFYDLPNVPYTMFFSGPNASAGAGFSLHGAYWHNNFGHSMSHGCVNMREVDAKVIYDWADPPTTGYTTNVDSTHPGTKITIYGKAP
ncbi:MAG TPA: L,D-transpeptidase [Patescibacteria group bacterium]